jgi:hypothetical protein
MHFKAELNAFGKLPSSTCLWVVLKTNFSKSLSAVGKRLLRHKFGYNFGFLLGFRSFIIFASFHSSK